MSNYNQENGRDASDQVGQTTDAGAEEFSYVEDKKPINRNMVVLLLIAVVGSAMVYLMYVRGRFNADTQIPEIAASNAAVSQQISGAALEIKTLEQQLAKTEDAVKAFQAPSSSGQIEADRLKSNPFAFPQASPKQPEASAQPVQAPLDPSKPIESAVAKVKVQMILYSATGSTAQLNTGIYRKGDHIVVDDVQFTIADIARDEVVLRHGSEDYHVRLPGKTGL